MPSRCKCPGCGQVFQVPDQAAGRRVSCPHCGGVYRLAGSSGPAPSPAAPTTVPKEPGWFVRTADDAEHGPMRRVELDAWARDGRLDGFCQLRRADWDHWKWAEEVFPHLALPEADEGPQRKPVAANEGPWREPVAAGEGSRLRPCPDCGKMISRRALECPHCGCPTPVEGAWRQPRPSGDVPGGVSRKTFFLAAIGALLVMVILGGIYVGLQMWRRIQAATDVLDVVTQPLTPPPAPEPPPAPPPGPAPPSAEQIAAAKHVAAVAAARSVDERFARDDAAIRQLDQVQQYAELSRALSAGADPLKRTEAEKHPPPAREPYRSQYQTLYAECLAWLDAHVPAEVTDLRQIDAAAATWAESKRSPVEQQLLGGQLPR